MDSSAAKRGKVRWAAFGGIVGLGGTLLCSLSMIAVAVGLLAAGGTVAAQGAMAGMGSEHQGQTADTSSGHRGGAGQGGMEGMGSNQHQDRMADAGSGHHGGAGAAHAGEGGIPGWLDFVLRWGPEILFVSVVLIVVSVALRRRSAALPAIGGGVVLYVGMYAQPNLALMYAAMAVGTVLLVLAYAASLRPVRRGAR